MTEEPVSAIEPQPFFERLRRQLRGLYFGRDREAIRFQVAMLLIANTVCAQPRPEDTLRAASALARSTDGIAAQRGEAELALAELVRRASAG